MAIANDTLFWATVDCHLIAFDRKTGRILWDVIMADWKKGLDCAWSSTQLRHSDEP